jgi:hypothetical protein
MKVEDLRSRGAGWMIRLHEKGGKEHAMPWHLLSPTRCAYIDAAGIGDDREGVLFRTSPRHNATALTDRPLTQANAWLMIRRRAIAAGITAPIGCHTFARPGSPPILQMAVRSNTRRKWRHTKVCARPSFTTAPRSASPKTRSSESGCKIQGLSSR